MASASHAHEDQVLISTKTLASRDNGLLIITETLTPSRRRVLFDVVEVFSGFEEESGIFRISFQAAFVAACRSEDRVSEGGRSFTSSKLRRAWESLVPKAASISGSSLRLFDERVD